MSKTIIGSATDAIVSVLSTVTATAGSVEKTVDIANVYVDNGHKRFTKTVRANAILATANHHTNIARELDADADLKAQFDALAKEW